MNKTLYTQHGEAVRRTLKEIREKAGLTQRDLCKLLGREHSFVSKYELGERRVDVAEFYWICEACGVNPETEARKLMKTLAELKKPK